ncbi:MAG: hypothetical protein NTV06_08490 [candidate division Zixibacteria bacterium]|nr:hypothetical protein [candidate division Zixibacteria bacterium]
MIIKSVTAPTVAGALKMIKEQMGGDAIILKTRLCPPPEAALTGNRVEVTACIDENSLPPREIRKETPKSKEIRDALKDKIASPLSEIPISENMDSFDFAAMLEKKLDFILNSHRTSESVNDVNIRLKPIYLNFIDADIPVEITRHMVKDIESKMISDDDVNLAAYGTLLDEIKAGITSGVTIEPGMKVMFIGPSGAGKTSAMAKLAAQLSVSEGKKVTLVSLDNVKVAAYEEIGGYAEMLNLPLSLSINMKKKHKKDTILLIDTPSLIGQSQRQLSLAESIGTLKPDILFLVFSVGMRSRDLIDSINLFESLSPTHLIAGHLDETARWGTILTMSKYLDKPVSYISDSPGGIGILHSPDPATMARRILKMEEDICNE